MGMFERDAAPDRLVDAGAPTKVTADPTVDPTPVTLAYPVCTGFLIGVGLLLAAPAAWLAAVVFAALLGGL